MTKKTEQRAPDSNLAQIYSNAAQIVAVTVGIPGHEYERALVEFLRKQAERVMSPGALVEQCLQDDKGESKPK